MIGLQFLRHVPGLKMWARTLQRRMVSHCEYPELCEKCENRQALHAHHFDYAYPLVIIYLCISCHQRLHMIIGRLGLDLVQQTVHSVQLYAAKCADKRYITTYGVDDEGNVYKTLARL